MNKYESVIIMKPDLTKSKLENVIVKVESKIGEYANITAKDDYGIRRLAYEVKKNMGSVCDPSFAYRHWLYRTSGKTDALSL